MALERNNTTTQFEPGCDPEFERILRRHLKLGGAPVAACVGFDADTASAFLENALGSAAHAKFESHLAGCPACRRHLIELSRLTGPISAPVLVPVPGRTDRLAALKQWFDFSSWGWKQQTAGLAATALLIGAVSSPLWLSGSKSENMTAKAISSETPGGRAEMAPAETSTSAPPASGANLAVSDTRNDAVGAPLGQAAGADKTQIPAPSVPVRVQESQDLARESVFNPKRSIELPPTFMAYAPPVTSFQPQGVDLMPPPVAAPAPEPPRTDAEATVAQSSSNLVGLQVAPKPGDNPMLDAKGERSRTASAQKPFARAGLTALVPMRRGDREEKPAAPARDEEETRPLLQKIRDRKFRFENDIWVDEGYTPNMLWRVKRLIRGSAEYEYILEREPQLKVFFEKAPILVIWRDSIYKVVVRKE